MITARILFGKSDLTMSLNGALAGLVAITAEPSTPTPLLAVVFGAAGGVLVVFSIVFLDKIDKISSASNLIEQVMNVD